LPDHVAGGSRFHLIPEVTARGWLIITRDSNISVNRAEIAAVRESGARMVALAGKEAIGRRDLQLIRGVSRTLPAG